MLDFKTFMEQQVGQTLPHVAATTATPNSKPGKPWKALKADVLDHWKNLQPNMQIQMEPVSEDHKGTRFRSDGFRITGSPQFINSVLSRIKDVANFEGEGDKYRLDVEYRQIESKSGDLVANPEYVFYCHLVETEPKVKKNPKIKV